MKVRTALLGLLAIAGCLSADLNDDVFSGDDASTFDLSPESIEANGPFFLRSGFDVTGKSKFTNSPYKGDKFKFAEFDIDGTYIFAYDECNKEGLTATVGYSRYHLDWNNNPYFDESDFNMISVGLGFFSHRLWNWDWKGSVKMNFDPDHLNFQNYVTWDLLLWGRYQIIDNWGFHAGVLALTGMKIDRIYPIIGLDWTINDRWKINAIFPVNFSVIYTLDCNWSFALASRLWDVRQRVGKSEPESRGLWEYRNVGIELAANYNVSGWNFNVHGGYTTGGRLKISDSHRHHSHRMNFNATPYVGGEVAVNF